MLQPPEQLCAQHAQLLVHTSAHDRAVLVCTADQVRPADTSQHHPLSVSTTTCELENRIRPPGDATSTPGAATICPVAADC
jgi:hypothetical protein